MEHGDLASSVTTRYAVVMEPLLLMPPERSFSLMITRQFGKWEKLARSWTINDGMVRWCRQQGYQHSIAIDVWSFLPAPFADELFVRIAQFLDNCTAAVYWWGSEHEAVQYLSMSPDIARVYDADDDRIERLWKLRGVRVPYGSHP